MTTIHTTPLLIYILRGDIMRKIIYCSTKDSYKDLLANYLKPFWCFDRMADTDNYDPRMILNEIYSARDNTDLDIVVTQHWQFTTNIFGVDNMFICIGGEPFALSGFTKRILRNSNNIPNLIIAGEFGDLTEHK